MNDWLSRIGFQNSSILFVEIFGNILRLRNEKTMACIQSCFPAFPSPFDYAGQGYGDFILIMRKDFSVSIPSIKRATLLNVSLRTPKRKTPIPFLFEREWGYPCARFSMRMQLSLLSHKCRLYAMGSVMRIRTAAVKTGKSPLYVLLLSFTISPLFSCSPTMHRC